MSKVSERRLGHAIVEQTDTTYPDKSGKTLYTSEYSLIHGVKVKCDKEYKEESKFIEDCVRLIEGKTQKLIHNCKEANRV